MTGTVFKFGAFELDTERHRLTNDGENVAVEPKVFDLLHLLVANEGTLISRDRLISEIWQDRIVSDAAVSACIAAARRAVDDDGKTQAIIRTVARRGVTCVANVERVAARAVGPASGLAPRLRFTRDGNGKTLAYAVSGTGPPLIYTTFGGTSIEAQWTSPFFRPLLDALGRQNQLVRFDALGTGHSDLDTTADSLKADADAILRVADAAGLDRFVLFSQSGASLTAVHLAAHHPDRVSRLILNGGYVEGRELRPETSGTSQMLGMISEAWDKPDSNFLLAYALLYFPDGPLDLARDIVEIMRASCPAENFLRMRDVFNNSSVHDLLSQVHCPTLVVHARGDKIHPLAQARKLAAGIAASELVVLESSNHVPMPGHADWPGFLESIAEFLGRDDASSSSDPLS